MPYKVALLIPTTTKDRPWKTMKDADLYNIQLKSFLLTYCPEHEYTYYLGIDEDDPLYSNDAEKKELTRFFSVMKNVSVKFISMAGISKGHLTSMWNRLFKIAYDAGNDYFYQCGDDVQFLNKGWVSKSIELLRLFHNIGVTGPHDKMQYRVHTQSFVSRRHYEIFQCFFPLQIINWFCDDWITKTYWEDFLFPLFDKWCMNVGGAPRYETPNHTNTYEQQKQICDRLIVLGRKKVNRYLKHHKLTFPRQKMLTIKNTMKTTGFTENERKYGALVEKTYAKVLQAVSNSNISMGRII